MDDLLLFRLLGASPLDAAALVPLLTELARVPRLERAPWLGRLARALHDPSAAVRAAAVAALDDATGPLGVREVVRALDDGDLAVREAAVRTLRSIAFKQPARFAHALFHAEPSVRAAALAEPLPPGTAELAFHLLADPQSAARLIELGVRPTHETLGALLSFTHDGHVDRSTARRWIADLRPADCLAWSDTLPARSPVEIGEVLGSEGRDTPGHDPLDELFALFCAADDEADRQRFFRAWTEHMRSIAAPVAQRVVAALVVAMRQGTFAQEALGLAVNHEPAILGWRSVPRALRAAAVDAIYREGPRRAVDDAALDALAECDLARRDRGGLDLRFLGALLCFRRTDRYRWLVEREGLDAIVAAFLRDIEHSAPFLSVPDRSTEGRAYVFERIAERATDTQRALVRAIYLVSSESDLSGVAAWPPDQRAAAFEELLAIEHHPALGFDAERAKILAHAITLPDLASHQAELLEAWLRRKDHASSALGTAALRRMAQTWRTEPFVAAIAALPVFVLRRALEVISTTDVLTFGQERALAALLVASSSPRVTEWAESRLPREEGGPLPAFAVAPGVHPLPEWLAAQVRTASDLEAAVRRCHGAPCTGLVAALRARDTRNPSVAVAVALLGCHDPVAEVARAFTEWTSNDPSFLTAVDAAAVAAWQGSSALPPHGDAWLWRFEKHAFAATSAMLARDLTTALRAATELEAPLFTEHLWAAASSAFGMWRWRERARLLEVADDRLIDLCVDQLDTQVGRHAAHMLASLLHVSTALELLEGRRERVRELLPDLADEVRDELSAFVSMAGLPSRSRGARAGVGTPGEDLLRRIAGCRDLDELELHCRSAILRVVHEATLRLVVLGDAGCLRVAALLAEEPPPPHLGALAASIPLWPDGEAVLRMRRLLALGTGGPELRFRVAMGLVEHGDLDALDAAVEMACVPGEAPWLARADVRRLFERAPDPDALARRLAISPHPHAYIAAVTHLVGRTPAEGPDADALRAFLACGRGRGRPFRVEAARWLRVIGDLFGLPLLVAARLADAPAEGSDEDVLADAPAELVMAVVDGVLTAGGDEMVALVLLTPGVDREATELALERVLAESDDLSARAIAVRRLPRRPTRSVKLRQLAEIFAWGLGIGRELTGRVIRVHMIASDAYGYTRLSERRVFVTPLPLLRGERRGREVVEGLILHELGHQRYHGGSENAVVWARADAARLGRLLNLVADEHLERNLRAIDASFGDRLKRLAAHAFQHADREIDVALLVRALGARTFAVLSVCRLSAARRPSAVRVETGAVLGELERAGSSFAKFIRALRMGLGHRHGDPKVDEALALFGRGFKREGMEGLWTITLELRRIFGAEAALADVFGGAESLEDSPHDRVTAGDGIADEDVQEEVERILGPPGESGSGRGERGPRRLAINVGADTEFDTITEVVHVPPSPDAHREVARRVSRHARRLRAYLERLGLALEPQRMRLAGRRLDTTRIRPLVTHGDPRFMLARETRRRTDLHLGMIVDCSGSMQGESMQRAHAFGVLLAEAVRGMRGVDLRIFGFDDQTIFDAGDARRPAVTSLEAGAGNNDAAGLWHAARVAMASRRKAKVLVMISDGLPTECSVEALRGLVRRLSRRHGLCCAQVAVRPLEEICFPHYVEIDGELDLAVRKFGDIVARLVGRTMRA